jgi:SNF2 family DNA or RNA helicase
MSKQATESLNIPGLTGQLYKHQVTSLHKALGDACFFDASEPGTGKTITQIAIFLARCHLANEYRRALVFATKSTMQSAWGDDIEKVAPGVTYVVATAQNRRKAFDSGADIVITNHDAATWVRDNPDVLSGFDHLIIDESTAYKNPQSQRTKALFEIADKFQYRNALSGLPTPNSITELWSQMFILDRGTRLGPAYWKFRSTVCTPKQVGPSANHIKWVDIEGIEMSVSALVDDITVRHKLDECHDLPEHTMQQMQFRLSPKHRKLYDKLANDAMLILREGIVDASTKATLQNKLLQLLSGQVYGPDGSPVPISNDRYDAVLDAVEERDHSLCAFLYTHQRDQLTNRATTRKISHAVIDGSTPLPERTAIVRDYQKGKYRVLFAHPATAAHGLTMTTGTRTIWPQPTFNLEHFAQFNRRIYRAGQQHRTETLVFTANVPLEQHVYATLIGKKERSDSLLEYLEA